MAAPMRKCPHGMVTLGDVCSSACKLRQMCCSVECIEEMITMVVVIDYTDIDGSCRMCGKPALHEPVAS